MIIFFPPNYVSGICPESRSDYSHCHLRQPYDSERQVETICQRVLQGFVPSCTPGIRVKPGGSKLTKRYQSALPREQRGIEGLNNLQQDKDETKIYEASSQNLVREGPEGPEIPDRW
jgi:hypothetical protein